LVELPLGDPFRDVAAMYRGMSHGRPVVNGYSGYFPPNYAALRFGFGVRDADVLQQLASHGVRDVVVDSARDGDGMWKQYVMSSPGTQAVCSAEGRTLYRLGLPRRRCRFPAVRGSPRRRPSLLRWFAPM
jgi:hypothetical protein